MTFVIQDQQALQNILSLAQAAADTGFVKGTLVYSSYEQWFFGVAAACSVISAVAALNGASSRYSLAIASLPGFLLIIVLIGAGYISSTVAGVSQALLMVAAFAMAFMLLPLVPVFVMAGLLVLYVNRSARLDEWSTAASFFLLAIIFSYAVEAYVAYHMELQ